MKKTFILFGVIFLFCMASVSADNIVLLAMDDIQVWWLYDIQEYIMQRHIDEDIPLTAGAIPVGIEDPYIGPGSGEWFIEKLQYWDSNPLIEIGQHGYTHAIHLEGLSYEDQFAYYEQGNILMESIGIYPKSSIPPFGSADDNTIQVLIDLDFHTYYNVVDVTITPTDELLLIERQLHLCQNDGSGVTCDFKEYSTLISEIDAKIQEEGVALVLYHMQDFEAQAGGIDYAKANQIVSYAHSLEADGYTLMTVEEYYQYHLGGGCIPEQEICDGIDNDCDNITDNNLTAPPCSLQQGVCVGSTQTCGGTMGWLTCNASNYGPYYEQDTEVTCDGLDNDCDDIPDNNLIAPACSLWYGVCAGSTQECEGELGWLPCDASSYGPDYEEGTELTCDDLLDNDCDRFRDGADSDCQLTCTDNDEDGYGVCPDCGTDHGCLYDGDDCDDTNGNIHPGALEVCNGINDDCNLGTDDGSDELWLGDLCDGQDSDLCEEGTYYCDSGSQTCNDLTGDNIELCNYLDDDCDTLFDEDWPELGTVCSEGLGICLAWGNLVCTLDESGAECDAVPGEPQSEICDDNIDNDCDGETDLEDPDCTMLPVCGDGICNGEETMANCCRDCGCASNQRCVDNRCSKKVFASAMMEPGQI
ncbi:MAG: MopE-related protein [archaeon]